MCMHTITAVLAHGDRDVLGFAGFIGLLMHDPYLYLQTDLCGRESIKSQDYFFFGKRPPYIAICQCLVQSWHSKCVMPEKYCIYVAEV